MSRVTLSDEQVLGRAPISREELARSLEATRQDVERGNYVEMPKTYAEFRKVILGIHEEIPRYHFKRRQAAA